MSETIAVLVGAVFGVLTAVLTPTLTARGVAHRDDRDYLRSAYSDLMTNSRDLRAIANRLFQESFDGSLPEHREQRALGMRIAGLSDACVERLQIAAENPETQFAARRCVHFTYWLFKISVREGGDWTPEYAHDQVKDAIADLQVWVRRELGRRHPERIHLDPPGGLPTPPGA